MTKLGLFFGAGAEINYDLPSGGQFALDIFRQDVTEEKERLRSQLQDNINRQHSYGVEWLPKEFWNKRIHAFGKHEFTNLIESSIEYRKAKIIRKINSFDELVESVLDDFEIEEEEVKEKYSDYVGKEFGEEVYSQIIELNPKITENVDLFSSEYYSAFLDIIKEDRDQILLLKYVRSFLELLVGTYGQELVQELNQDIFTKAPDDIPIFDDLAGMFRIEFSRAGMSALDLLLEEDRSFEVDTNSDCKDVYLALAHRLLENLFTDVLDYKSLIDSHFRYLYSPKAEWAKFTKMVIFLRNVRKYISNAYEQVQVDEVSSYYDDLADIKGGEFEVEVVGTSNYNNLIEDELGSDSDLDIYHLNGSTHDYINPYTNAIKQFDAEDDVPKEQIFVPFILTQSGTKPMTSIEMSKRYVDLFEHYKQSDVIVIVGFSFGSDDGHINGLFRELVEEHSKKLVWVTLGDGYSSTNEAIKYLSKKLRINTENRDKLEVLFVEGVSRQTKEGNSWIEALDEILAG